MSIIDEYKKKPLNELFDNADKAIDDLCKKGFCGFTMSIPVQVTDTDIVLSVAVDAARQCIAELERKNELLRAVAVSLDSYFSCDINNSNLMDNLQGRLEKALLSAIDGGAFGGE